jgi:hypothetical protein
MLWREPYRPQVLEEVSLPSSPASSRIILGAFDLRAQREIGVWLRLLTEAGLAGATQIVLFGPASMFAAAEAVFPPSLHNQMVHVEDLEGDWRRLLKPENSERSFAMVLDGALAKILVIGTPTEEVWDEFQDCVRQSQSE